MLTEGERVNAEEEESEVEADDAADDDEDEKDVGDGERIRGGWGLVVLMLCWVRQPSASVTTTSVLLLLLLSCILSIPSAINDTNALISFAPLSDSATEEDDARSASAPAAGYRWTMNE